MMKRVKLAMLLAMALMTFLPAAAMAQCFVNDLGVLRLDSDCDQVINNTDMTDGDFDGIPDGDPVDNCPYVRNGNCDADPRNCDVNENGFLSQTEKTAGFQMDWNKNEIGDVCDDTDFDGVFDYMDNCKTVDNADQDPSVCTDTDGDKFEDPIDNCPVTYNPNQQDTDEDDVGDSCDNCRMVANTDQADSDDDHVGDACPGGSGFVNPDVSPDDNQDVNPYDRPGYNYGEDQLKGNGFGDGGCSMINAQAGSHGLGFILAAVMALTAARRRS